MPEVARQQRSLLIEHDTRDQSVGHSDCEAAFFQPASDLGGAISGSRLERKRDESSQERLDSLQLSAGRRKAARSE